MKNTTQQVKKHAFGILLFRRDRETRELSVFLAKANGPRYWAVGSENVWGLPKGRADEGETPFESASREFFEEIGSPLPNIKFKKFMDHHRPQAEQMITVFTGNATDVDVAFRGSNTQVREWPIGSGQMVEYAEIVDARWFPIEEAIAVVLPGQRQIIKEFAARQAKKTKKKLTFAA